MGKTIEKTSLNYTHKGKKLTSLHLKATAPTQSEIEQEYQAMVKELEVINEMSQAFTTSLNLQQVLQTIIKQISAVLPTDGISIFLVDEENKELVLSASLKALNLPEHLKRVSFEQGIVGWTAKHGQPQLVSDVAQDDRYYPEIGNATNLHVGSTICAPLMRGGKVLGAIQSVNRRPNVFTEKHLRLLMAAGNHAAIAIENARLHQKTYKNLERISILYEASQINRHLQDRQRILKLVTTSIHRYFNSKPTMVFEVSSKGVLSPLYLPGVSPRKVLFYLQRPWQLDDPDFSALVRGDSIQIDNLQAPQYAKFRPKLAHPDAKSWYAIPLQVADKTLGALVLIGSTTKLIPTKEMQLLHAIAGHIAAAMENNRLIKEMETQTKVLHQTNQQLMHANKIKDHFVATMSHELRTPLNSIIGYSYILQEEMDGPLAPKQLEAVEKIKEGGESLLAMINDILDLSKMEDGELKVYPYQFPIQQVIEAAVAVILPLAQAKALSLVVTPFDRSLLVYADPGRLRQLLVNLLSNAVKFTDAGEVCISVTAKDKEITLSVSDTGMGIPNKEIPYLFEKFYQIDSAKTRQHEGSGLGLAIVKQITEAMRGSIKVESELDKGSVFTVTLPQEGKERIR